MAVVKMEERRSAAGMRPGQALRCPNCGVGLTFERRAVARRRAALPFEALARLKRRRDSQPAPRCIACEVALVAAEAPDDRRAKR